jgi:hypothetical protein
MLPNNCPKFQLSVQRLRIKYGDKCRVLMMQSAPDDSNTLIIAMKELIKEKQIKFCTWRLYTGLSDEQKQTIIDSQNNNYRSITLSGFADYDIEVPMVIYNGPKDEQREPHWLEKITVNEYISKHIISGDGTPLFTGVQPTINNTKEFCMPLHLYEEAKEWAEVGIGELCRNMNEVSTNIIFKTQKMRFSKHIKIIGNHTTEAKKYQQHHQGIVG